jgi:hypothetical protein
MGDLVALIVVREIVHAGGENSANLPGIWEVVAVLILVVNIACSVIGPNGLTAYASAPSLGLPSSAAFAKTCFIVIKSRSGLLGLGTSTLKPSVVKLSHMFDPSKEYAGEKYFPPPPRRTSGHRRRTRCIRTKPGP